MRPVIPYVTAALLFGLGVYGVLRRRNAVLVLMSVELMLNAVNLLLVTAVAAPLSTVLPDAAPADPASGAAPPLTGQVFALFVIVLAAAEVGVGLAIVLRLYRLRGSVALDEVPLDGPPDPERSAAAAPGLADAVTDASPARAASNAVLTGPTAEPATGREE